MVARTQKTGITVIGVHTPGTPVAEIEKVIEQYDLRYPMVIDTPRSPDGPPTWGWLSGQYSVFGIPYAFVIDRQGRIAGHGTLQEVLAVAWSLPEPPEPGAAAGEADGHDP